MEALVASLIAELLKFGMPGAFIGYLLYVNHRLSQRVEKLEADKTEVQEKRVLESAKTTSSVMEFGLKIALALEKLSEALDQIDERERK